MEDEKISDALSLVQGKKTEEEDQGIGIIPKSRKLGKRTSCKKTKRREKNFRNLDVDGPANHSSINEEHVQNKKSTNRMGKIKMKTKAFDVDSQRDCSDLREDSSKSRKRLKTRQSKDRAGKGKKRMSVAGDEALKRALKRAEELPGKSESLGMNS